MNPIEEKYNELKDKCNLTSENLRKHVSEHTNSIGLVADEIWLRDPECLRLKHEFRLAEYNFKTFIKMYKAEVKQIQKQEHIQRKNKRLTHIN